MSIGDPLWLLALALLPLALLARRLARRRAGRYAMRFPAAGTVARALAEGVPQSRLRKLPAVALLAALAAAVVAIAGPRLNVSVPVGRASVVLVLDHSGSMASTDVNPTRLQAAVNAANTFIAELPASVRLGAVGFSTTPDAVQRPVSDHAAARSLIDTQQAGGGTDTGPALQLALQLLNGGLPRHPPAAVVLLSDGAANLGVSPVTVAAQARRDHIRIYTVALGTPGGVLNDGIFGQIPVPPDPQLMAAIARTSGARAYDAQTAGHLSAIYRSLGQQLGSVRRRRDISVYFLVAAAGLLLGAVLGSARTMAGLA